MNNHRVLVIDDHPVFRKGLVSVLRSIDGIAGVDEVDSAAAGYERWQEGQYALVCLDLSLPNESGFSLLTRAVEEDLAGAVLVVSMYDQPAYRRRAREEGAAGFVSKAADMNALEEIVHRCLDGGEEFVVADEPLSEAPRAPLRADARLDQLTPTEKRVLELVGRRLTSRAVANVLNVSVRTVQNHRANICGKLGLSGPHRLLEFALSLSWQGQPEEASSSSGSSDPSSPSTP